MPARVCLVAPEFIGPSWKTDVGAACYWEACALGDAGLDVTVLHTGSHHTETPAFWERHFEHASFTYEDLAAWTERSGADAGLERFAFASQEARTAELVLAWLRQQPFDLVLFQDAGGHGARALQARQSGAALGPTRAAVTLQSSRQRTYEGLHRLPTTRADLAVDFLERESARLADVVITPSRHMARWAADHWHLPARSSIVPVCYDASAATPRGVVDHRGPFLHLVYYGRLDDLSCLRLFCDAIAESDAVRATVQRVTFLGESSPNGRSTADIVAEAMAHVVDLPFEIVTVREPSEALVWLRAQPQLLIVAPYTTGHVPYRLIELHTEALPFVSTDAGAIAEVVGPANRHLIAPPHAKGLGALLTRVYADGHLAVDYRDGYDVAAANRTHVDFVAGLLTKPRTRARRHGMDPFSVVVVDAQGSGDLERLRARWTQVDLASNARWFTLDRWCQASDPSPAIFVALTIVPERELIVSLLRALENPEVDVATSYYRRREDDGPSVVTPLGRSLESGWSHNCFGGPCFAAASAALLSLKVLASEQPFSFWPIYSALACRGLSLAVVPQPLYAADTEAPTTVDDLDLVVRHFHATPPTDLDLGWLLKSAVSSAHRFGPVPNASIVTSKP